MEQKIDIAATTERETNKVKLYSLPDLKEVGEISVFDGETERGPMGISCIKILRQEKYLSLWEENQT
jgi:3-phytase